NIHRH
ncbi:Hypothetical protein, putative, partial [Bodo saltans]